MHLLHWQFATRYKVAPSQPVFGFAGLWDASTRANSPRQDDASLIEAQ